MDINKLASRLDKALHDFDPYEYADSDGSIEKAKEMLLNTDLTVHEISSKTGFENVNHFINLFKRNTGLTPNVFRNRSEIT